MKSSKKSIRLDKIFNSESTTSNNLCKTNTAQPTIYAEEFRQHLYCKRILYWRRIAKVHGHSTYLMEKGTTYHNQREKSTYVRSDAIQVYHNRYFYHEDYNIAARVDTILEYEDHISAVEYKRFYHFPSPFKSHIIQCIVGGLAAEFELDKPLTSIEIQYYQGKRSQINLQSEYRKKIIEILAEMREILTQQILPLPVKNSKKCEVCEYYKICRNG